DSEARGRDCFAQGSWTMGSVLAGGLMIWRVLPVFHAAPPPSTDAVLPLSMQPSSVTVLAMTYTPPPLCALLFWMLTPVTVAPPDISAMWGSLSKPPPRSPAELLSRIPPYISRCPKLQIPPPNSTAVFQVTQLSSPTVSAPSLSFQRPPPSRVALFSVITHS